MLHAVSCPGGDRLPENLLRNHRKRKASNATVQIYSSCGGPPGRGTIQRIRANLQGFVPQQPPACLWTQIAPYRRDSSPSGGLLGHLPGTVILADVRLRGLQLLGKAREALVRPMALIRPLALTRPRKQKKGNVSKLYVKRNTGPEE